MGPTETKIRLIIPAKWIICTKRADVTRGEKLANGETLLVCGAEKWWWTFYLEDGGGISFCTGDIAPPDWKPKARIILELEQDAEFVRSPKP